MNKINDSISFLLILVSAVLLSACGGGSGSSGSGGETFTGNTAPAQVSESNAQEIGETAGESISQAAGSSSLPTSIEVRADDISVINSFVINSSQLSLLPSGIDVSDEVCTGGGTANVTISGSGATSQSGPLRSRAVYGNCVFNTDSLSYTIDGVVIINYDDIGDINTGFYIEYQNVTVSGLGFGTQTLNYTFSCTNLSNSSTCTQSSVFVSESGGTHLISDYSISGTSSSGLNGTATFSHEVFGTVSITVSAVTYGNCGSIPDGGSISFSSSNGTSGTINFAANCTSSGTWNNGVTAGSF